ncbi:hypothetical protein KDA11_07085 [Candidatus Saccharibacteria bacterium]|nr:hypothetical protein [Candidatus Saccharibacteria bacterium]
MQNISNTERLAVVEIEIENTKEQVTEIKGIVKEGFEGLNAKFDDLSEIYVTKKDHRTSIAELRAKRWYENTMSAIAGSVLTGIIGYILLEVFRR